MGMERLERLGLQEAERLSRDALQDIRCDLFALPNDSRFVLHGGTGSSALMSVRSAS